MTSRFTTVGVCTLAVLLVAGVANGVGVYLTTTANVHVGTNDLLIRNGDVALYDSVTQIATLAFDRSNFRTGGGTPGAVGNVDAFHVLSDGTFLLSTDNNEWLGSNMQYVRPGDIVQYDGATDTASIYFDQDNFRTYNGNNGAWENVDAVHVLANGNILLSTSGGARLGAPMLHFADGDLVEYDPLADTAAVFMSEGVFRTPWGQPGGDEDIDGVSMLDDGTLVLTTRTNARLGDPMLSFRDGDIVAYDIYADSACLFFSEDDLHCSEQDIDGVAVLGLGGPPVIPEPLTVWVSAGLVMLAGYIRRRARRAEA